MVPVLAAPVEVVVEPDVVIVESPVVVLVVVPVVVVQLVPVVVHVVVESVEPDVVDPVVEFVVPVVVAPVVPVVSEVVVPVVVVADPVVVPVVVVPLIPSVTVIFLLDSVPDVMSLTVTVTLPTFLNFKALSSVRVPFARVCAVSGNEALGSPSTRIITCLLYVVSIELSFLTAEIVTPVAILILTVSNIVIVNHLRVFTGVSIQAPSLHPFGHVVWMAPIFCLLTHCVWTSTFPWQVSVDSGEPF